MLHAIWSIKKLWNKSCVPREHWAKIRMDDWFEFVCWFPLIAFLQHQRHRLVRFSFILCSKSFLFSYINQSQQRFARDFTETSRQATYVAIVEAVQVDQFSCSPCLTAFGWMLVAATLISSIALPNTNACVSVEYVTLYTGTGTGSGTHTRTPIMPSTLLYTTPTNQHSHTCKATLTSQYVSSLAQKKKKTESNTQASHTRLVPSCFSTVHHLICIDKHREHSSFWGVSRKTLSFFFSRWLNPNKSTNKYWQSKF